MKRSEILVQIFVLQVILQLGWIAVYPYGGYVILALWIFAFVLLSPKPGELAVYSVVVGTVITFYLFPRAYPPGNVAWHLTLLVFSQVYFLSKEVFSRVFDSFAKFLIILCVASIVLRFLIIFGFPVPYRWINLDPQFFNLYWPFYIERLNASVADFVSLLGSFRFQGPFFEPGALGIALGACLYANLNRFNLVATIIFGVASLSMTFFFIAAFRLFESAITKKSRIKIIGFSLMAICLILVYSTQNDYFMRSTIGRFIGSNDKLLNTRLSHYEAEQIALYSTVFFDNIAGSLFGIGWDTPGSGGSHRVWLMGAGVVGLLTWLAGTYTILKRVTVLHGGTFLLRLPTIALLCYVWGNWMSPIFLFILFSRPKEFGVMQGNDAYAGTRYKRAYK